MKDRFHDAVARAKEQFWASIAASFPEITSGDFPPDATLKFDDACSEAAAIWVTGNQPSIDGDPKLELLESLGYDIDTDSDQPGMWIWSAGADGCERAFGSARDALDAAWADAVAQAMRILDFSAEQWNAQSFDHQAQSIRAALAADS
ncbi:MAG: hypothetical protein OEL20_05195 [Sulfuritalea sp.]|nr:hypothetical protein [Sulfuritalea sp.]